MHEILRELPNANVKVYALWAPYLQTDSRAAAGRAAAYLSDSRASHFWDLWKFGSRVYADQFNYPQHEAWDLFVLYRPGILWQGEAPRPTTWFQHRDLPHGTPYTKAALRDELLKMVR